MMSHHRIFVHRLKRVELHIKEIVPCESSAEEVSFEWSHHRILSIDSKFRTSYYLNSTM